MSNNKTTKNRGKFILMREYQKVLDFDDMILTWLDPFWPSRASNEIWEAMQQIAKCEELPQNFLEANVSGKKLTHKLKS